MSLNDCPPYLQPRIRHITSLRIHRLAVPRAEVDADTKEQANTEGGSAGGIEGYDLAVPLPRGSRVRYTATEGAENGLVKLADGQVERPERERGLLEDVIHDVLAEEVDEGLRFEEGNLNGSETESQSLTASRRGADLPDLQFRRNRRRTSNNSTITLPSITQNTSSNNTAPLQEGRTRSFSHLPPPTSPISLHGFSTSTPGSGGTARRPSISTHRSRSRLTIPRHVDREFDTLVGGNNSNRSGSFGSAHAPGVMNGNASPLVSPISPGFFIPLPIPERAVSSRSIVGSSSSVPVDIRNAGVATAAKTGDGAGKEKQGGLPALSSLPCHNASTKITSEIMHEHNFPATQQNNTNDNGEADAEKDDGITPYDLQRAPNPDRKENAQSSTDVRSTSRDEQHATTVSAPTPGQTRARSTSISSSRSHLHTYTNLHIPQSGYTTVTSGAAVGVGGHRRERSGTVSSVYPVHNEEGEGGRRRQQLLNPHPEESASSAGISEPLHLQQMAEEVAYVDQRILRNRLVRCFVTFATVETDEGRSTQQKQQQQQRKEKDSHGPSGRRKFGGEIGATASRARVNDTAQGSKEMHTIANALFPFYISPIHIRSTHPTFSGLSPRSDYASWLCVRDAAAHTLVVDVWVELEVPDRRSGRKGSRGYLEEADGERMDGARFVMSWVKLKGVGGIVDLRRLHEVDETLTTALPENTLIFTFSTFGDRLFYFELPTLVDPRSTRLQVEPTIDGKVGAGKATVNSVMERSLRETRMRKSVGLGELHHMMNLYTVVRDTERDVRRMERDLDAKVAASAEAVNEARACSKQTAKCNDLQRAGVKIRTGNTEHAERNEMRRNALRVRRAAMEDVKERYKLLDTHRNNLSNNLHQLTSTIESIQLPIYRHRARSIAQVNDIFEIAPVDAATLLYSILHVPLPIPQHASEAAPPLSLPSGALPRGVKVDEDTISTALGFVALAVNQISHILDRPLTYPLTCAGSKSLVKDTISIIQGPRRGVEKYRYDYGVFLLNKNIELLMVDARIKLEDMRHTLPNLKMLLLTLAAQDRPRARAI
ncbi:hypothetical protein QFC21_001715 [Naganishia friedmannii]|uniref:Uncharacterized protein n=1 Tax=Naganishia friedmannii TaxID=89922 RepID=A0ACC2W2R0_9TREE|nr:hypothetical protein QFC21_001715 [Naganishia friedmannii]